MGFSFNWGGIKTPTINAQTDPNAPVRDAANLGRAVRGYENRKLDNEYAEMVKNRGASSDRVDSIKAEIARLEARNAEIRAQLGV